MARKKVTEKEQLAKEIKRVTTNFYKLEAFLDGTPRPETCHNQIVLMLKQSLIMEEYLTILNRRLRLLELDELCDKKANEEGDLNTWT